MSTYYTNELVFELPDLLKDKTHHVFSLSDDGPSAFNVVISRNPISNEETLQTYGERLAAELKRALPQFEFLSVGPILVAGGPSWGLEYRWRSQGQWLHQRQASLFYMPAPGQRQVVQITATVAGGFTQEWKQVFAELLGSIRLRLPDASVTVDSTNGAPTDR